MNDVKRAYRSRIRSTHPDLSTDDEDRSRRERDSSLINVAFKTLTELGTGSARASGPAASASTHSPPHRSTEEPREAAAQSTRTQADEKYSEAKSKPQTPPEPPRGASVPEAAEETVSPPETSADVSIGLLLVQALFSLNYWYGISLALRAAPFVLFGALLRALGFWTSSFTADVYAELTPSSGVWAIGFGSLAAIVMIGAIGNSRPATITLTIATVLYGSFLELLAHLSWYQHVALAGLIVLLPATLILRQPISLAVTWLTDGFRRN